MTFVTGERVLSEWMDANARVSGVACSAPWELEDYLIAPLDLQLNLEGNARNAFHRSLSQARAAAVARAKTLPVVPNPGGRRPLTARGLR